MDCVYSRTNNNVHFSDFSKVHLKQCDLQLTKAVFFGDMLKSRCGRHEQITTLLNFMLLYAYALYAPMKSHSLLPANCLEVLT